MLEHRQATDGRNPFCACPLKIQWVRLRRFTFYFLRAAVVKVPRLDAPTGKSKLFFLVAVIIPKEGRLLPREAGVCEIR